MRPENVEVDDGDIDTGDNVTEPYKYQKEGDPCRVCDSNCFKNSVRKYLKVDKDKVYPKL